MTGPTSPKQSLVQEPATKKQKNEEAEIDLTKEDGAAPSSSVPATLVDPDRPTDEEIVKHMEAVRNETVMIHSMIGERERLDTLAAEYENGSQIYRDKVKFLQQHYRGWRRSRGDGNCFLRSFIFAHLEGVILMRDAKERDRLAALLEETRSKKLTIAYQPDIVDDFMQPLIDLVSSLVNEHVPFTLENLVEQFRGDGAPAMIYALRMICGAELRRQEERFAPFVMGMTDEALDVPTFIQKHVDVVDTEFDHIQIVALTEALQIPVRILYLDQTPMSAFMIEGSALVNHFDFDAGLTGAAAEPRVHLLYRPGHYDVCYPK